jgi:predicted CopG family antitoxin
MVNRSGNIFVDNLKVPVYVKCMAVKTITIDMEAYEILVKAKRGKESFSQVIKHTLNQKRKTARNLLEHLDEVVLNDSTLDSVDELIKHRKDSPISSPEFD